MAVDVDGRKHVLGLWLGKGDEGAKFWLGVITRAQKPGRDRRAEWSAATGWQASPTPSRRCGPTPRSGTCVVHLIRNSIRFCYVERPQSRHQSAQTPSTGGHHRSRRPGPRRLRNRMGRTISAIVDLWRHNWERFCPFLAFDAAIRKIIYTTNAIESLNYQLHKLSPKPGGISPPKTPCRAICTFSSRSRTARGDGGRFFAS